MTTVDTSAGTLRGRVRHGGVVEFLGVRYAHAARFGPPEAPPTWTGVRDAHEHGPVSPQLPSRVAAVTGPSGEDEAPQDEDCLRLDVRGPVAALTDGVPRPVLVWIHGGAYVIGAAGTGWYDTMRLVAEGDVVTVNVGYRLGVLGWLRAPGVAPGNLGLLDLIAALRWVRDEIAAFGGDPGRVTAAGQSAGAHAIACLLTVPEARPLVRRAILQSGQLGLRVSSVARAERIGGHVVEEVPDPATADVRTLLRAQRHTIVRAAGPGGFDSSPAFAPVDGVAPLGPGTTWDDTARSGHDLIIGSTRDEVETFLQIHPGLRRARRLPVLGHVAGLGSAVLTRRVFGAPVRRLADAAARAGSRVHHYRMDWAAPDSDLGACHCIELPFLFGTRDAWTDAPMLAGADWDTDIEPLGARMRAAWLAFVRDGDAGWPVHAPGAEPGARFASSW